MLNISNVSFPKNATFCGGKRAHRHILMFILGYIKMMLLFLQRIIAMSWPFREPKPWQPTEVPCPLAPSPFNLLSHGAVSGGFPSLQKTAAMQCKELQTEEGTALHTSALCGSTPPLIEFAVASWLYARSPYKRTFPDHRLQEENLEIPRLKRKWRGKWPRSS